METRDWMGKAVSSRSHIHINLISTSFGPVADIARYPLSQLLISSPGLEAKEEFMTPRVLRQGCVSPAATPSSSLARPSPFFDGSLSPLASKHSHHQKSSGAYFTPRSPFKMSLRKMTGHSQTCTPPSTPDEVTTHSTPTYPFAATASSTPAFTGSSMPLGSLPARFTLNIEGDMALRRQARQKSEAPSESECQASSISRPETPDSASESGESTMVDSDSMRSGRGSDDGATVGSESEDEQEERDKISELANTDADTPTPTQDSTDQAVSLRYTAILDIGEE